MLFLHLVSGEGQICVVQENIWVKHLKKKGNQDKGSCLVDFITKGMGLAGGHNRRQKGS